MSPLSFSSFPAQATAKTRWEALINVLNGTTPDGPQFALVTGLPGLGQYTLAELAAREVGATGFLFHCDANLDLSDCFQTIEQATGPVLCCFADVDALSVDQQEQLAQFASCNSTLIVVGLTQHQDRLTAGVLQRFAYTVPFTDEEVEFNG